MFTKHVCKVVVAASLLLGAACSGKNLPEDSPVDWTAEDNAIELRFNAANDLNLDRGQPSSLPICVYQLSEAQVFEYLLEKGQPGLDTLDGCEDFGDTVMSSQRIFLEPGQNLQTLLNRQEGTRFVGLSAAYHIRESDCSTRLYEIPVIQLDGRKQPGQLLIELNFGPEGLQVHAAQ